MTAGRLRSVVTYLEMTAPPALADPAPPPGVTLERAHGLTVDAYRHMYRAVGELWMWWERLVLPDELLEADIADPAVEIRVLRRAGAFAGYSELDCRQAGEVEIAYFGLTPDSIGHGLGRHLMTESLRAAWRPGVHRVWLHTCTEDHPSALGFYKAVGFRPTHTQETWIDDPRDLGLLPPHAGPYIPRGR